MLPDAGDEHAEDAPGDEAEDGGGDDAAEAFGVDGLVGEVGFGDGFEVELLALGFVAGFFERGEGGGELAVGEAAFKREAFVFGGLGGEGVFAAGDFLGFLGDFFFEGIDAQLECRRMGAVGGEGVELGELAFGFDEFLVKAGDLLEVDLRLALGIDDGFGVAVVGDREGGGLGFFLGGLHFLFSKADEVVASTFVEDIDYALGFLEEELVDLCRLVRIENRGGEGCDARGGVDLHADAFEVVIVEGLLAAIGAEGVEATEEIDFPSRP